MLPTQSLTLVLLLCLGLAVANVNIVFNKTENYILKNSGSPFRVPANDIRNSLMTIVACQNSTERNPISNCSISITDLDSNNKPLQCDFEFDEDTVHRMVWHSYTTEKAILMTKKQIGIQENYVNYTIINFADCKTNVLRIDLEYYGDLHRDRNENRNAILFNDDGTFDIFYNHTKTCGEKVCRLTISSEGKKVKGPTPSFLPLVGTNYRTVKKLPSSSSFIVQEMTSSPSSVYRASLVKPEGQLILNEFKDGHEITYESMDWNDISTSNGFIRRCNSSRTTKVDCELFDFDTGKSISKISVDVPGKVGIVNVENIANGEFLLLPEPLNERKPILMKIKNDGSLSGVVQLTEFASFSFYYVSYESYIDVSNNQYCVTRKLFKGKIYEDDDEKILSVLKECYDDSDFH